MSDDLKRLIRDAAQLDFEFHGPFGGHFHFVHTSGQRVTTSSTPGDWRAWINFRAQMERISGKRLPRASAGSFKFKKTPVTGFRRTAAEVQAAEGVDALITDADRLRTEFAELSLYNERKSALRARKVLQDFENVKALLASLNRVIDPI